MFSLDPNTNTAVERQGDRVRSVQACGQPGKAQPKGSTVLTNRSWVAATWRGGLAIATIIALIRLLWWRLEPS